jgi:hypothetical protein
VYGAWLAGEGVIAMVYGAMLAPPCRGQFVSGANLASVGTYRCQHGVSIREYGQPFGDVGASHGAIGGAYGALYASGSQPCALLECPYANRAGRCASPALLAAFFKHPSPWHAGGHAHPKRPNGRSAKHTALPDERPARVSDPCARVAHRHPGSSVGSDHLSDSRTLIATPTSGVDAAARRATR